MNSDIKLTISCGWEEYYYLIGIEKRGVGFDRYIKKKTPLHISANWSANKLSWISPDREPKDRTITQNRPYPDTDNKEKENIPMATIIMLHY